MPVRLRQVSENDRELKMFEEKDGECTSLEEYIVKIETIANSAPIGIPYEIWCSVDHVPPGAACIRWQARDQHGNTLPDAVWKSTTTDIGAEFPNMARGIVTVPHVFSGEITVTANLATSHPRLAQQPGTKRLRFFAWDGFDCAPPHTIGFTFDKEVVSPLHREDHDGLDDANTVELSIRVLTAWGTPIEGAEVQWLFSPEVSGLLFLTANSPFSPLNPNSGGWSSTLTNGSGLARIRVTSTRTLAVTATAHVPGVDGGGGFGTIYFVSQADPSLEQLPAAL